MQTSSPYLKYTRVPLKSVKDECFCQTLWKVLQLTWGYSTAHFQYYCLRSYCCASYLKSVIHTGLLRSVMFHWVQWDLHSGKHVQDCSLRQSNCLECYCYLCCIKHTCLAISPHWTQWELWLNMHSVALQGYMQLYAHLSLEKAPQ